MSKGDWPRKVDREKFNANWDRIFRKDGKLTEASLQDALDEMYSNPDKYIANRDMRPRPEREEEAPPKRK